MTLTLTGIVNSQMTRLAVIGDFGQDNNNEAAVASMIRNWDDANRLDAVLTVGDNNYPSGSQSTVEGSVGKYYSYFMYPYKSYKNPPLYKGAPDSINRFFPATGNHDWMDGLNNYLDYYAGIKAPDGTPQHYYVKQFGPVGIFILDSMYPNLQQQNTWLQQQLSQSTAAWKLVLFHHPPYSSGDHGNTQNMQQPYFAWGAHAVINGHDHDYERISKPLDTCSHFPYMINGMGGAGTRAFPRLEQGSIIRYTSKYGAQLILGTPQQIQFQFISSDNIVQDTLVLTKDNTDSCRFVTNVAFGAINVQIPVKVSSQPPPPPRKLLVNPPPPTQWNQDQWPNWPNWPRGPNAPRWPNWPNWPNQPRANYQAPAKRGL